MARSYRSRRYRPTRRISRRYRRGTSMKKIKRDIMKCNFPTKVKFMGLSEKKVMFLTSNTTVDLNGGKSIYLNPLRTSNISSIMSTVPVTVNKVTENPMLSNWDKMCILGIYIKMQPVKNFWTGAAATTGANAQPADTINEIRCTYTYNNVDGIDGQSREAVSAIYDAKNIANKQVFTFNSNEAFTIYIPAPPTMTLADPCVHKSKTWWSLTDLLYDGQTHNLIGDMEDDEDEDNEAESDIIGSPFAPDTNPMLHCGRLFFTGEAKYNITINYKVALKG